MPKKVKELFKCVHCGCSFQMAVRFCRQCSDHFSLGSWVKGKDVCDRCHAGLNDAYLKRKKALDNKEYHPPHLPTEEDRLVVQRYLDWVKSPAYAERFTPRVVRPMSTHLDFCVHCNHAKAYHEKTCIGWGEKPCGCKGFEPKPAPRDERG